jgi:hypothetical protein
VAAPACERFSEPWSVFIGLLKHSNWVANLKSAVDRDQCRLNTDFDHRVKGG